ncbi:MFS transporter [Tardiphaga sp. P9-11]|uniref:MFS transporter n=1 Tax=Tardiphaga sp. P9-11 TaxID=2024614 RepID=UPI001FEEE2E3|nr:MFS transporter [Tardiphaga sp. P9-11]
MIDGQHRPTTGWSVSQTGLSRNRCRGRDPIHRYAAEADWGRTMTAPSNPPGQTTTRVLLASLVGTTVEFYDFYIYATAASLIFGPLFFPASVPSAELIGAYASFGVAFFARPLGGAVFGHFGDRVGRKTTLVASLLLMGASTASIAFLPTFQVVGWPAPFLLCVLRFGQGLALGGEWTGAALLALENAPAGWRARYAMFAPLGAPVGFVLANGMFLTLTIVLTPDQFQNWGWRIPFLASVLLVLIGLWVRTNLMETQEFTASLTEAQPARVPLLELMRNHSSQVLTGTFGVVACFSLYYTATAFALGYGTSVLGYSRSTFLLIELGAIFFMAGAIVVASWLSDRLNPAKILIVGCLGTILSGILLAPMLGSGSLLVIFAFLAFSLLVMGFVNGPLGAWLPNLFPPRVRYSGTSFAFNIGGILGGAFSPVISQALADSSGLTAVGFYLAITGGVSLIAFDISLRRQTSSDLALSERRYRSIFEQTHVSLCELDLSRAYERLMDINANGAKDMMRRGRKHLAILTDIARLIEIRDVNDAAVRLLGCSSKHEPLGPIDRYLAEDPSVVADILLKMPEGGGAFERQVTLTRADGRKVTAILFIAVPEGAASFDRVACAMIDVTEREAAKEAMLNAQAELARAGRISTVGAVSASIAHEVNQPIGAMVMSAQACVRWLAHSPPNIDAATRAAERAIKDGMRAADIVQRTREQLKHHKRHPEPIDLREVLAGSVNLLERELTEAGVVVRTDLGRTDSTVLCDRVELQQVIVNLLTNGVHAMTRSPLATRELRISIYSAKLDEVNLSVRDTGSGIDVEHLAKLFNPFFTTKREGMGIGLAICKTIVEAHGGTLTGANHPQGGAVFDIVLPLLREEPMDDQTFRESKSAVMTN